MKLLTNKKYEELKYKIDKEVSQREADYWQKEFRTLIKQKNKEYNLLKENIQEIILHKLPEDKIEKMKKSELVETAKETIKFIAELMEV